MANRVGLDTIAQFDPGAPDPIGTKQELKRARLPLVKYASCSMPGKHNRGCKHFNDPSSGPCPIRALLAKRSRPGPEYVSFTLIKSPTIWKRDIKTCFGYMDTLHHQDPKLGLVQITGIGGDPQVIKVRGTVPKNPQNPKDSSSNVVFDPMKIPKFPRPDESMAERIETVSLADEIDQARKMMRGELLSDGNDLDEVDESEGGDQMDKEDDFDDGLGGDDLDLDDEETGSEFGEDDGDDLEDEAEPAVIRQVSNGKATRQPKREPASKPARKRAAKAAEDEGDGA